MRMIRSVMSHPALPMVLSAAGESVLSILFGERSANSASVQCLLWIAQSRSAVLPQ
jgi:hypothetical protein